MGRYERLPHTGSIRSSGGMLVFRPTRVVAIRHVGGVALVTAAAVSGAFATWGCAPACTDLSNAYLLDADQFADLQKRYGSALPQNQCVDLCTRATEEAEADGGGGSGGGATGGLVGGTDSWDSCSLITIETAGYSGPGILCEGTRCFPQGMGRQPARATARARAREHYAAVAAGAEAASVIAFEDLARDLGHHDAPVLAQWARRAAHDELEHAAAMGALALAAGATPGGLSLTSREPLTLEQLALENAGEGLVTEGAGARVLAHQARHAQSAAARTLLGRVARDEADHYKLSLAIHRWARRGLGVNARRRVDEAARAALSQLSAPPSVEATPVERAALGLPDDVSLATIHARFAQQLHRVLS